MFAGVSDEQGVVDARGRLERAGIRRPLPLGKAAAAAGLPLATAIAAVCTPATQGLGHDSESGEKGDGRRNSEREWPWRPVDGSSSFSYSKSAVSFGGSPS